MPTSSFRTSCASDYSVSNGPVLSVEIEHWSFLPSQHLLGMAQMLSDLLYVKPRAPSPLNNSCPESYRFVCMVPTHHIVSTGPVKHRERKAFAVDDLQSLTIPHPPHTIYRQHRMRVGQNCLASLLLLLRHNPVAHACACNGVHWVLPRCEKSLGPVDFVDLVADEKCLDICGVA